MNEFEWDINKSQANLAKHGISFDEAITVFFDDFARILADPDHSIGEERWLILGYSVKNRLLAISFTDRKEKIRIINARKATKNERKQYEEFNK
ncbi:MAG: BrnT family toxin [FCB group bacterium]|jgi:uncharacterized DUF497 family protein